MTLTVTARGQVTFRKSVLQHLGVRPGQRLEVDTMPDGRITLRAAKAQGSIEDVFGCLSGLTTKVATLEEIQQAIEEGWAGLHDTNAEEREKKRARMKR